MALRLTEMSLAELQPALKELESRGVTGEDLLRICRNPFLSRNVSGALGAQRRNLDVALGKDEQLARAVVSYVTEVDELVKVVNQSPFISVAHLAVEKLSKRSELVHVVLTHPNDEVADYALSFVANDDLYPLVLSTNLSPARKEKVVRAYTERHGYAPAA